MDKDRRWNTELKCRPHRCRSAQWPSICLHTPLLLSISVFPLGEAQLPCSSPSPGACSNICLWCHPTMSSSVVTLLLLPLVFPRNRELQMVWFTQICFPSGILGFVWCHHTPLQLMSCCVPGTHSASFLTLHSWEQTHLREQTNSGSHRISGYWSN